MEQLVGPEAKNSSAYLQGHCAQQYVTFKVGTLLFGVDIARIQEIIRFQPLTEVPLAPCIVKGLVNLRGQILTAIDMRALLQLSPFPEDARPLNVIVTTEDEIISLLVDSIGDVVTIEQSCCEKPPSTLPSHIAEVIDGVCKLDKQLMLILDPSASLVVRGV